ncbi:hypothetical protein AB1Y20_011192, partial [Prymnesium parvum]
MYKSCVQRTDLRARLPKAPNLGCAPLRPLPLPGVPFTASKAPLPVSCLTWIPVLAGILAASPVTLQHTTSAFPADRTCSMPPKDGKEQTIEALRIRPFSEAVAKNIRSVGKLPSDAKLACECAKPMHRPDSPRERALRAITRLSRGCECAGRVKAKFKYSIPKILGQVVKMAGAFSEDASHFQLLAVPSDKNKRDDILGYNGMSAPAEEGYVSRAEWTDKDSAVTLGQVVHRLWELERPGRQMPAPPKTVSIYFDVSAAGSTWLRARAKAARQAARAPAAAVATPSSDRPSEASSSVARKPAAPRVLPQPAVPPAAAPALSAAASGGSKAKGGGAWRKSTLEERQRTRQLAMAVGGTSAPAAAKEGKPAKASGVFGGDAGGVRSGALAAQATVAPMGAGCVSAAGAKDGAVASACDYSDFVFSEAGLALDGVEDAQGGDSAPSLPHDGFRFCAADASTDAFGAASQGFGAIAKQLLDPSVSGFEELAPAATAAELPSNTPPPRKNFTNLLSCPPVVAWEAAWRAAWEAAWRAAWEAAWEAAWRAAWGAVWEAVSEAVWEAVSEAVWEAVSEEVWEAVSEEVWEAV